MLCLLSCALLVKDCPRVSSNKHVGTSADFFGLQVHGGAWFHRGCSIGAPQTGRKYSRTRSRASSQQITSDPNVQATSSKRCGSASIHTRVFAINPLWHCACLARGSPVEPSSDAALLRPAVNSPRVAANFGAKKCQHRIESAIGEPLCGTSLSIKDLYATPGIQKLLSEPHLKDSTSRATFQSVSIVAAAC